MELKFLTNLGIAEDVANKILAAANKEVDTQKELVTQKTNELQTANTSVMELTGKLKAFDGVDIEALKTEVKNWETKYNTDISNLKLQTAIDKALSGAKSKDPALVATLLDKSILKLDDKGDLTGLTEQLDKIRKDKAFLFESEETKQADTGAFVSTGDQHRTPSGGGEVLPMHFNYVRPRPAADK